MMFLPTLIAHADWGSDPRKRWIARGMLQDSGRYLALAPEPVGEPSTLLMRLLAAGAGGCVLLGFDFPIGLPAHYATQAGVGEFLRVLPQFGQGRWEEFYQVSRSPHEISLYRPFYPDRPGGARRHYLLKALEADSFDRLRRRCELSYPGRRAAAPLFWTLGGQQAGKAAICGWRDVLGPGLRDGSVDLAIWPFSGPLQSLCRPGRIVVAEAYPAEYYSRLGIAFSRRNGRMGGKRVQAARALNASALLAWAQELPLDLHPLLLQMIRDGFGSTRDGEDRFDAVVGLFGLLDVVLRRPPVEIADQRVRKIEGWILGQAPC